MLFNIINSGSKGNATIVKYKNTVVLIDMGITLKCLEEGLDKLNLKLSDIDAAIFTHNHTDHISGLKFLSPSIQYALLGTLPTTLSNVVELWTPFIVKDMKITPVLTNHDAKNPCGYLLQGGAEKLVYITDTGYVPEETIAFVKNPTYLILESNHDIKMLLHTNRPYELKYRILSEHGHLCNEDSAIAACSIIGPNTKEVILAHLSEEANTPEKAKEAYYKMFKHYGVDQTRFILKTAHQREMTLGGNYED